jgi:MarR family transcriptional repressor of emrRAB
MARALPDMPMDGTVMVRLLRIVGGGLTDFFEPEFRAMGLTENGFHVLCLLVASEDGRASPSTLSEMVGTSRANMTRILEQLDRDGWIERQIVPGDGRRQIISVSAKGRQKVDATVPLISDPISRAFDNLDQTEMEMLAALLRKLVLSLDHAGLAQPVAA